jgi:zinc transporter ZupT
MATSIGLAGAALGLWLTGMRQRARVVVPFSAGVLLGVAVFGLVPELAIESGWLPTLLLFTAGYGLLLFVNRRVYPVCPTCAHDHDHNACATELHGFALPLLVAAAVHSFFDGWSVATVEGSVPLGLRVVVPLAVGLHKLPEGIALGGIMRAALKTKTSAMAWCALAEGATLVGGAAGLLLTPHMGQSWMLYPLGVTAGWLFYLGFHAVHEEWKRRGATLAFLSALSGIVSAAAIQRGAEALFQ